MTTLREAAQQALEALEMAAELQEDQRIDFKKYGLKQDEDIGVKYEEAITALRDVLAQEEQEPTVLYKCTVVDDQHPNGVPFEQWVNAPRREWQGLTMQEINALPEIGGVMWRMGTAPAVLRAIRAIERALKEKNHG